MLNHQGVITFESVQFLWQKNCSELWSDETPSGDIYMKLMWLKGTYKKRIEVTHRRVTYETCDYKIAKNYELTHDQLQSIRSSVGFGIHVTI